MMNKVIPFTLVALIGLGFIVVQYVKIVSEKGKDCTVENPWPGRSVFLSR